MVCRTLLPCPWHRCSRKCLLKDSLLKYPDIPILTTKEVSGEFRELEMVMASEFNNKDIKEITESNFEQLVDNLTPFSRTAGTIAGSLGVGLAVAVSLWPFVIAYYRE